MGEPTFFTDDTAIAARASEVPDANFANGMNAGGSNAPAVGVNIDGGLVDTEHFTLLDQDGDVRVPQASQSLGGVALGDGIDGKGTQPVITATNQTNAAKEADPDLDGVPVITGTANLQTLEAGWVNTII